MVDGERLPLVVAEVLLEAQRPLEHLLRGAHRERGLRRDVLEGRPVPVHGGVVEVGAELPHRVLRVRAQEELSAQSTASSSHSRRRSP